MFEMANSPDARERTSKKILSLLGQFDQWYTTPAYR